MISKAGKILNNYPGCFLPKIKIIFPAITFCFVCLTTFSQVLPEWAVDYSVQYPARIDQIDMASDKNGNICVTGYSFDTSYSNTNLIVLKYNSSGQLQWINHRDSVNYSSRIVIDDSGNVFVAGLSDIGMFTIKYNPQGVEQWIKTYPYSHFPSDIIADDSGNVYLTGISHNEGIVTLKYNTAGDLLWAVNYGPIMGVLHSILTKDDNQDLYLAARGYDTLTSSITCNTIKYDRSGNKKWERVYRGNPTPRACAPVDLKYKKGFIYVLAGSVNTGIADGDIDVVKYDTLGNEIWMFTRSFTSYYDIPKSLAIDNSGNAYVTGNIWPTGGTIDSIVTLKINNSGFFEWSKMYSSGYWNTDQASGIVIDSLGYIVVTGRSADNQNYRDFVTIRYDSLGNQNWLTHFKNTPFSNDMPNSISVDQFGNIYVCGLTLETTSSGILTIKYSKTVAIEELNSSPTSFVNIYPNPFEKSLTIHSELELIGAEIIFFDELGREMSRVSNIRDGVTVIYFNNLVSGMYFYTLIEKNREIAKGKLVAK